MGKAKKRQAPGAATAVPSEATRVNQAPASGASARPRQPGFSNVQLGLLFGSLLLINYYGMSWLREWYWDGGEVSRGPAPPQAAIYGTVGEVGVRKLESFSSKFAEECSAGGVPVVLRNSVVEKWRARKKWTPKYMQSKMKHVSGVYQNENRWFGPYYDTSKPLTHLSQRVNSYHTDLNLTSTAFFQKLQSQSEGKFLYFTGDIDQLGEWAVDEIQPLSELLTLNPKHSSINAWIGPPHVIAHCHYDGYHNFYVQLYGTKKFTLFSPSQWPGLYPYPFLHPSHAQAQVNLSDVGQLELFPLAGKTRALEVILQPGDLLYMPPLWFHHVESMELSISVNVWTDSNQTAIMEDVFSTPLTEVVESADRRRKAIAACVIIHTILRELCSRKSCRTAKTDHFLDNPNLKPLHGGFYYVYQLWTTRYRMLMESGHLPDGTSDETGEGVLCEHMDRQDMKTIREEVTEILEGVGLGDYVERVVVRLEQLPDDTWELWVGNYIEFLVFSAVEVQEVGAFLRHYGSCFSLDEM